MIKASTAALLTYPDVLIIGGGAAGVAAAVGASEEGASVVLLEKNGFLGGKATAAYVGTVCGLYYRSENHEPRFVNRGFPMQFALQLQEMSQSMPVHHYEHLSFLPYERFAFMQLCDHWTGQTVESLCLHSHVFRAEAMGGRIQSVDALAYHQPITFYPKAVVDTSGEAVIARLLNADMIKSDEYQASAVVFSLTGLVFNDPQVLHLTLARLLRKGLENGGVPADGRRISIVPGSAKQGQALFKIGIPLSVTDEQNRITTIETEARKMIAQTVAYLRANSPIFSQAQWGMVAPEVGIRTGPRHLGKQVLTEAEVLGCLKTTDTVARGAWPIEHWPPGENPVMMYFDLDDYYDIPVGALCSASIENLFFGGRNLSATDQAVASARVIGTALATGYAAGKLAAGCIQNKESQPTITAIQAALEIGG